MGPRARRGTDSRFEGHAGQPAVGEATPTYLADPVALDRMAATIPDARLLAVLRDPVDRAYSHYWMEHARDREPRTFEQAVADELAGRPATDVDYLDRGRYVRQLGRASSAGSRAPGSTSSCSTTSAIGRRRPTPRCAGSSAIDDAVRPAAARRAGQPVRRVPVDADPEACGGGCPSALRIGRIVGRLNAREGGYPPMAPDDRGPSCAGTSPPTTPPSPTWLGRDLSMWA